MQTQQQQQTHNQSSYEHHANHPHTTHRCYLRTPDMKCKIQNVSTDQSVTQLKQKVKQVLGLDSVSQSSSIKLIVNETELTDDINLAVHLFQNAIIHVLVPQQRNQDNESSRQISIKIKQPPIFCPSNTLQNIPLNLNVKQLKSRIISFYQQSEESNPIGSLNESGLYLVYGGRILTDDKTVGDYDIDQNGILYIVDGNVYAREVTKEEADRRIEEVKRGQYTEAQVVEPFAENNQFPQQNSELNEHQDLVFNIIQNIVHDEDSDIEGQTANDLARSQKIIHRYDSVNKTLPQNNDEEDRVVTEEQGQQRPIIDEAEEEQFKQQISQHLTSLAEQISQKPQTHEKQQNSQQQASSGSFFEKLIGVSSTPIPSSFDEENPIVEGEIFTSSQNDVQGVSQSLEDHPDSVPQTNYNQDEDMLL